jgi:phosphate transport system substrate-binding protein
VVFSHHDTRRFEVNRSSMRRALVPTVAALALGFGLTACGAGNETPSGDSTSDGAGSLSGTIAGGGSSAQEKAQGVWRAKFQGDNPDVTITYDPVGSGDGRQNFISSAYAFAGSDSYLSDDEGELADAKTRCGGEDPIEVPAYVSPIAVAFNLPGVDSLNLSAKTVGQIFSGKITKWNDPAIAADNAGVKLPSTAISPVHRSDDSGTTKNFTHYLSQAGEGSWTADPDGVWPLKGGEAGDGTSGVVAALTGGEGTIGYADDSAIKETDLGVASIKVGSAFNAPSAEGAAQVVAESPAAEGRPAVDMAIDVDRTTTEAGAYPLLLTSYLIACQHYDDATQADLVKGFLTYILSADGQQAAADEAGSAPLDTKVAAKATTIVAKIAAK